MFLTTLIYHIGTTYEILNLIMLKIKGQGHKVSNSMIVCAACDSCQLILILILTFILQILHTFLVYLLNFETKRHYKSLSEY